MKKRTNFVIGYLEYITLMRCSKFKFARLLHMKEKSCLGEVNYS